MYSDQQYDDGSFNVADNEVDVDINTYTVDEGFSDPLYPNSDQVLQTAPRNNRSHQQALQLMQYNNSNTSQRGSNADFAADDDGRRYDLIGNLALGSPQPTTVKKLKTHLSGIGGMGGYLTSPMGLNNGTPTQNSYLVRQQQVQNYNLNQMQSTGSPMKSSLQHVQNFPLNNRQQVANLGSPAAPHMQRFQTAPCPQYAAPLSNNQHYHPASQAGANIGLGIPGASLNTAGYAYSGNMGRSHTTDGTSLSHVQPDMASQAAHIPRASGSRTPQNMTSPTHPASFQGASPSVKQEAHNQLSPRSAAGFDKPFIQYLPPNSPAAKSAARNKRQLVINTKDAQNKASKKLVAVKMTDDAEELRQQLEHRQQQQQHHHHQNQSLHPQAVPITGHSPRIGHLSYPSPQSHYSHTPAMSEVSSNTVNMPSFEFSLQQFGMEDQNVGNRASQGQMASIQDQLDMHTALGLPVPNLDSGSSVTSGQSLLSPPPHSASSTHSSVFSTEDDILFGLPPSPFFAPSDSIDQALASLLSPNSQQQLPDSQHHFIPTDALSPHHLQQAQLGVSSPPISPHPHSTPAMPRHTHPAQQWSPYSVGGTEATSPAQFQTYADMTLQPGAHAMLSPHNSNYSNQVNENMTVTGRPLSSPRRLRGMQSAPNLAAAYNQHAAFGGNYPPSSTRKVSTKRGRDEYTSSDAEDGENQNWHPEAYGNSSRAQSRELDDEDSFTDDDGDYMPQDRHNPPPAKRRLSTSAATSRLANKPGISQQLHMINPNPTRLRPGPKPKASLPNLQAARQTVFVVSPHAPPVPTMPSNIASGQDHSLAPPSALSPLLSPDLADMQFPRATSSISKDQLASFYTVGIGSRQTKKGKPQRMYICSIPGCGKEFPRKSAVESHIQTHLEDKPFVCPYEDCGASFVRSHDLTRHVRIHSGSKPFQCVCGKGFARGDALTRHRQRGICEGSLVPRRE